MTSRIALLTSLALTMGLSLSACKQGTENSANAPNANASMPPAGANSSQPATANASASIASLTLGNALGEDFKVKSEMSSFKPTDTIYASSVLATSDPAATVSGTLSVKWLSSDKDTVVKEESKTLQISNSNVLNFPLSDEKGLVPGKYKVEVSLNTANALTKEFEIK